MDDALRWHAPLNLPDQAEAAPQTGATARFGGDGNDAPVLVAVINGPIESEMARDALVEANIPALVKRNSAGSVYGLTFGSWGSAEVWTLPNVAEQARDVLIGIGVLEDDA